MNLSCFIPILTAIFIISVPVKAVAQTQQLNKQIAQTEQRLKALQKQITQNKQSQSSQTQQLKLLSEKIDVRKSLISKIDKSIVITKRDMGKFSKLLNQETQRIDSLTNLSKYISICVYKSLNKSDLEETKTINHLRKSLANIYKEISESQQNSDSLKNLAGTQYNKLMMQNEKLNSLSSDKKNELATLFSEQNELDALRKKLQREAKNLSQLSVKERQKLTNLQNRIKEIIAQEALRNRKPTFHNISVTKGFAAAKGKMPSPLQSTTLVERYGVHSHPTKPSLKVNNTGVNLRSKTSRVVSVVFSGVVRSIFVVPGMGSSVLVRHGNYLTVYSNLSTVSVKNGQNVYIGYPIGELNSISETLHFEIWNETKNLNPQYWVKF